MFLITIPLLIGTGCNFIQSARQTMQDEINPTQQIIENMNKLIEQENKNDTLLQKMATSVQEAGLKTIADQKITDLQETMIPKVNQAKNQITEYKSAVEKVKSNFQSLQTQVKTITNPTIQQLSKQFLTDFEASIEAELSIATKYEQLLQNQSTAIQAIISGKSLPTDNSDQLVAEIDQLAAQFQEQVKKLNNSYNQMFQEVNGK